ncbi:ABC transporter ATP-binding protein [Cloacibacillus evryensis]|uniref:ABC transporter ATP-binding protein n=1 Tax=Cloacibacillus evryensis TaxID=508460 RepID=UPI0026DFCA34|nr:ABC transporter ATP-binding protein [Cloacibacillus evryensis]
MTETKKTLVSMRGVDKIFYGKHANKGVEFELLAGEVHSILGENGAGKTTLMNCLAGIYLPDAGSIYIEGKPVFLPNPKAAIGHGVGMVHQHFMLVPVFTVWENIILGLGDIPLVINKEKIIARIREISDRYSLAVDPEAKVWQLSIGEQQRVEILKMLYRGTKVLILDEPTSVLTPQETRELFKTLKDMVAAGHGIILISHKIEEIMEISDRLTVLRKGVRVATREAAGVSKAEIAEMMVGHSLEGTSLPEDRRKPGGTVLECSRLTLKDERGTEALKGVSLAIRGGEILGVAGVDGNGQDELCEVLAGLRSPDSGSVSLEGNDITSEGTRGCIEKGISYIPADRKGVGLVANMSIIGNIALKGYCRPPMEKNKFFMDWAYITDFAAERVKDYDVQIPDLFAPVRVLSGGNLQKLMLSREISEETKVIIAMQPTWGLDVGAAEFVHKRLIEAREAGAAVLLISKDLQELTALSDRIAVMYSGEISGVVDDPRSADIEKIGLLMAGVRDKDVI